MRSTLTATLLVTLLGLGLGVAAPTTASAAAKSYKNCTALNASYPGGVAKSAKSRNTKVSHGKKVAAASKYRPTVSASLYQRNSRLDRDKDGIACER